jgi:hypothetical protein
VNHQATFLTYNLYLSISLRATVAVRALDLECLVKILDWGRIRNRCIFSRLRLHLKFLPTPTPPKNSFRLRLHLKFLPTPTPPKNSFRLRLHLKFLPTPTSTPQPWLRRSTLGLHVYWRPSLRMNRCMFLRSRPAVLPGPFPPYETRNKHCTRKK